MEGIEKLFVGPTAIAYSFEDPAAPAKIATKVAKGEEKFVIKGGYVDGKALDVKGVEALSKCRARTSCARLSLQLLVAAPQNFLALLRPRRSRCSGCWRRASSSSGEGGGK